MNLRWDRIVSRHRMTVAILLAASLILALVARIHGLGGLALGGVALLVSAGLLLVVKAPIGHVPLAFALVIALTELLPLNDYVVVMGLALLVTIPAVLQLHGPTMGARRLLRWSGAAVVGGLMAAIATLISGSGSDAAVLARVTAIGVAFLATDLVLRRALPVGRRRLVTFADAWPVYASVLCAAVLLAAAYNEGGAWMAAIALAPLLLTRFAFDRYAAAEQTYQQTIRALSIVPEVAGTTPFGHGERSAAYAETLARKFGLADDAVDRVVTAARLHHIGYVALDEDEQAGHSPEMMARLGGDILRETRFLGEVGDLVEAVQAAALGHNQMEAAVVRVASDYDHLVRDDPLRARGALEIVSFRHPDEAEREVVAALRELVTTDPDFIIEAIACGAPLTEAAAASGVTT